MNSIKINFPHNKKLVLIQVQYSSGHLSSGFNENLPLIRYLQIHTSAKCYVIPESLQRIANNQKEHRPKTWNSKAAQEKKTEETERFEGKKKKEHKNNKKK